MQKINLIADSNFLEPLTLKEKDVQNYVLEHWEIIFPHLQLIKDEFQLEAGTRPNDAADRVDILAFNPIKNCLVIIELKRYFDKNILHQLVDYQQSIEHDFNMIYIKISQDLKFPLPLMREMTKNADLVVMQKDFSVAQLRSISNQQITLLRYELWKNAENICFVFEYLNNEPKFKQNALAKKAQELPKKPDLFAPPPVLVQKEEVKPAPLVQNEITKEQNVEHFDAPLETYKYLYQEPNDQDNKEDLDYSVLLNHPLFQDDEQGKEEEIDLEEEINEKKFERRVLISILAKLKAKNSEKESIEECETAINTLNFMIKKLINIQELPKKPDLSVAPPVLQIITKEEKLEQNLEVQALDSEITDNVEEEEEDLEEENEERNTKITAMEEDLEALLIVIKRFKRAGETEALDKVRQVFDKLHQAYEDVWEEKADKTEALDKAQQEFEKFRQQYGTF